MEDRLVIPDAERRGRHPPPEVRTFTAGMSDTSSAQVTTAKQRGLVWRYCGCRHPRVVYARPAWAAASSDGGSVDTAASA